MTISTENALHHRNRGRRHMLIFWTQINTDYKLAPPRAYVMSGPHLSRLFVCLPLSGRENGTATAGFHFNTYISFCGWTWSSPRVNLVKGCWLLYGSIVVNCGTTRVPKGLPM
jgi:hypothetical protein